MREYTTGSSSNVGRGRHGLKLFVERAHREGFFLAYDAAYKRHLIDGKRCTAAQFAAARELGYFSKIDEEEKRLLWTRLQYRAEDEVQILEEKRQQNATRKSNSVARAIAKLPPTADPRAELDWIRSHPAMMRKSRHGGDYVVKLRLDDIQATSEHAACPSKAAANQLQFWANHVEDFHRQWISSQRKAASERSTEDAELGGADDLSEARSILGAITGEA